MLVTRLSSRKRSKIQCLICFISSSGVHSCLFAGTSPKPATSSKGESFMDYIIAGLAALGLFIYLVYALLRPEKF